MCSIVGGVEALLVAGGHGALDNLVVEELALQESGDEIPAAHSEVLLGGEREASMRSENVRRVPLQTWS
jgi:hypothetical protein